MPLRPAAWFFAILFFMLLIADIVFGFVSIGWDEGWPLWGPIFAVAISWVIGLIGGVLFSIFILRVVKFLTILYMVGFIVLAIWAVTQGQWGIFWIGIACIVATWFAGGFLHMVDQSLVRVGIKRHFESGEDFVPL